jgi:hypothetical protein
MAQIPTEETLDETGGLKIFPLSLRPKVSLWGTARLDGRKQLLSWGAPKLRAVGLSARFLRGGIAVWQVAGHDLVSKGAVQ